MDALPALVLFGVIGALMWALVGRAKRHSSLAQIGQLLGGGHDPGRGSAWGNALGAPTILRFTTRGSSSNTESWTEIDVDLPPYPLSLNLRRHRWLDRGRIERGTMVDVLVGDPPFDEAFLIEAAPVDVAKLLLDHPTRTQLASYDRVELTTEPREGRPVLRLAVRGWLEQPHLAQSAAQLVAGLATRVREAYVAAEQAVPTAIGGSPFRPLVDDQPARDAAAGREAEVARIEALRHERKVRDQAVGWIIFIVAAIIIAGTMLSH